MVVVIRWQYYGHFILNAQQVMGLLRLQVMKTRRCFAQLISFNVLFLLSVFSFAGYPPIDSSARDCDGLAQLPIGSIPGTCLGLLADNIQYKQKGVNFKKPRKALELPQTHQILVTDMGGWTAGRGILWLLEFESNRYRQLISASKVAEKLVLPHDIKLGIDGNIYLGEAHQITRFRIKDRRIIDREAVIAGLPYPDGKYLHPLTSFVFLKNNDLLINVGSKTDDCGLLKKANSSNSASINDTECAEIKDVGLRRYGFNAKNNRWDTEFDQYATGLRNSVALLVHSSGTILQGENSADLKDANEPYEEINLIEQGGYYGWPYCMNRDFSWNGKAHAFNESLCNKKNYKAPYSLMPPHVAPLDMIYYTGTKLAMLTDQLLMSWHGYRVVGNRLVSYEVNSKGLPILTASESVSFQRDPIAPQVEFTQHFFAPKGGSKLDAQHREVISHWNSVKGLRPEGAPVGLLQLADGSVLIVDDKNKALLRLSNGTSFEGNKLADSTLPYEAAKIIGFNFSGPRKTLMIDQCSACHNELKSDPGVLLNSNAGWLRLLNEKTLLQTKLTNEAGFMPPTGKLLPEQVQLILQGVE